MYHWLKVKQFVEQMNENGSISLSPPLIKIFPRPCRKKESDEESGHFAYQWLTGVGDFNGQPANRSNSRRIMTIYEANRCTTVD